MAETDLWDGGHGTPNTVCSGRVRLHVRPPNPSRTPRLVAAWTPSHPGPRTVAPARRPPCPCPGHLPTGWGGGGGALVGRVEQYRRELRHGRKGLRPGRFRLPVRIRDRGRISVRT